jgi:hypothetical protein
MASKQATKRIQFPKQQYDFSLNARIMVGCALNVSNLVLLTNQLKHLMLLLELFQEKGSAWCAKQFCISERVVCANKKVCYRSTDFQHTHGQTFLRLSCD